jgi:hypothetical protein
MHEAPSRQVGWHDATPVQSTSHVEPAAQSAAHAVVPAQTSEHVAPVAHVVEHVLSAPVDVAQLVEQLEFAPHELVHVVEPEQFVWHRVPWPQVGEHVVAALHCSKQVVSVDVQTGLQVAAPRQGEPASPASPASALPPSLSLPASTMLAASLPPPSLLLPSLAPLSLPVPASPVPPSRVPASPGMPPSRAPASWAIWPSATSPSSPLLASNAPASIPWLSPPSGCGLLESSLFSAYPSRKQPAWDVHAASSSTRQDAHQDNGRRSVIDYVDGTKQTPTTRGARDGDVTPRTEDDFRSCGRYTQISSARHSLKRFAATRLRAEVDSARG